METSQPVSASGVSAAVPQGGQEGVLFCHAAGWRGEGGRWWGEEGAGEVTLAAIRGQPPRSSIFRLDSVLSAGALVLLNTSSGGTGGGLHCGCGAFALHPCGSEVNVR